MQHVSVVIPAYNAAPYIAQAIESVLSASATPSELIVVDDGSTDETAAIVDRFPSPVRRVHQANRGVAAALNTGILESRGELVAFQGADDVWLPNKLDRQLDVFRNAPDVGLVYTGFACVDAELRPLGTPVIPPSKPRHPFDVLFPGNAVAAGTVLIRRHWLERVGLHETAGLLAEDWDLWIRLAAAGCRFAGVPAALLLYRIHGKNLTADPTYPLLATSATLGRAFQSRPPLVSSERIRHAAFRHQHIVAAMHYEQRGEAEQARAHLRRALSLPWDAGRALGDGASYLLMARPPGRLQLDQVEPRLTRLDSLLRTMLVASPPKVRRELVRFRTGAALAAARLLLRSHPRRAGSVWLRHVRAYPSSLLDPVLLRFVGRWLLRLRSR